MSPQFTSQLLDLPPTALALLFQHVASGRGGIAHAEDLSLTCKFLHSLSADPAVTYSNLVLTEVISTPCHRVWQWLAKRTGCIAGLNLNLSLGTRDDGVIDDDDDDDDDGTDSDSTEEGASDNDGTDDDATDGDATDTDAHDNSTVEDGATNEDAMAGDDREDAYRLAFWMRPVQLADWIKPLQVLSKISGVQLRVEWVGVVANLDHPWGIAHWLKQHGQLMRHLTVEVRVSNNRLKLRDFSEAAAPCTSIDLTISALPGQVIDLADLGPAAASLSRLTCIACAVAHGNLRGANAFNRMSQLTALEFDRMDFGEETWGLLAELTSLQDLRVRGGAGGDPSPLSALTGLKHLKLQSFPPVHANIPAPFSFSSLQPLSTLQQLEELHLEGHACGATSLQGLAGLSKLLRLTIAGDGADDGVSVRLRSLEGISPGVQELRIEDAPDLVRLAGIVGCTSMEKLSFMSCSIHSLPPLRGFSSLMQLHVFRCCLTSLEGINSRSLQSLSLAGCLSLTQLSGVQHLPALKSLVVTSCGVTSLRPLSQLGEGLQNLNVSGCKGVQEEVLELPLVKPRALVAVDSSNVREVLLAGGVRKVVCRP
jgi:hypothetical protein